MIRTERLLLRRWRDEDRITFAAMNLDPAVREHYQGLASREVSDAYVDRVMAHWDEHGWGPWALELPGVAPFVGYVGLWPADFLPGGPAIEVGWRLAHEHWGHGYATEAAREALRVGFTEVVLDEIVSFTVPQNLRSIAVMERIGLVRDRSGDFDHPNVDAVGYPHWCGTFFIGSAEKAGSSVGAYLNRTFVLSSVVRWPCRTTTASSTRTPTSASSTVPRIPRS